MFIFKKLVVLVILAGLAVGGIYFAHDRQLIPRDLLAGKPYQAAEWTTNQVDELRTQYQPTISHLQTVQEETGAVLGEFIQVNEQNSEKKLYEKTLDQAQYLYCKQVVEQWEKQTQDTSSPQ